MTISSFAAPTPLPVFVGNQRMPMDVWCDGYQFHGTEYDGRRNKVEITPMVKLPGFIGCCAATAFAVGQSYTIGCAHLTRLAIEAQRRTV